METEKKVLQRYQMVETQIVRRGLVAANVLDALRTVARHDFVSPELREVAYADHPLPIGCNQTISQPYIVALMLAMLELKPGDKVLEIGLGSGYQAALLAQMGMIVYAIEIIPELAEAAQRRLARLGYQVEVCCGDGYTGWPEAAPFAGIIVAAAPPRIPEPLKKQLASQGRLVMPVGVEQQNLVVITRQAEEYHTETLLPVRFVPMTGKSQTVDSA